MVYKENICKTDVYNINPMIQKAPVYTTGFLNCDSLILIMVRATYFDMLNDIDLRSASLSLCMVINDH